MKNKISITLNEKILRDVDSIVDNIFIRNRSQAIEYLIKQSLEENKTAVILADNFLIPKMIRNRFAVNIHHSTIIERNLRILNEFGFNDVFIVSDHETLSTIFKIVGDGSNYGVSIEYVDEEKPKGSASALKLLRGKIKKSFLVLACDILIDFINLEGIWNQHLQEKSIVTMLVNSSVEVNKGNFGYVKMDGKKVISYVEKPPLKKTKSSIFYCSVIVAEPELLSFPGEMLERDIFPEIARKGLLYGYLTSEDHLHIHTKEDLERVKRILMEKKK